MNTRLLLVLAAIGNLCASDLTPQELRGRTIYRTGRSASGQPITAVLGGGGGTEVKGDIVTCAGCHGLDGRGRPEGGVLPSSVRWQDLTRPYPVTTPGGRRHPPYTERLLIRAIGLGSDPAGNPLQPAMPRFALTLNDAADLIAYLKRIATDYDPGLSDDTVRLGVLLPPENIIQTALRAYFAELNRSGKLYGRNVELVFRELPGASGEFAPALETFLNKEPVFALLSSFIAGAEKDMIAVLDKHKVPLIGARTLLPQASPFAFYLDSGLRGQAEALQDFAPKGFATLVSADELYKTATQSIGHPSTILREAAEAEAAVRRLKSEKAEAALLLLREQELRALIAASRRLSWHPIFLIPGSLATPAVVHDLESNPASAYVALPLLASDVTAEAQAEYQKLGLSPRQHWAAQCSALSEAKILTEALKRAGRELSRERLIQELEGLYDFSPGFSPAVSFGPSQHVGIRKLHVIKINSAVLP